MTIVTQAPPKIAFLNTTFDEVTTLLKDGQRNVREVAELLAEPIPNVMGVWTWLRDQGEVEARNMAAPTPAAPPPAATAAPARPAIPGPPPARPTHTPDPALTDRIAHTTDLLVRSARIDDKRIQAALGRARKAMTDLAGLVDHYESKAAARNRIARLEAELRIARAELNAKPKTTAAAAATTPPGAQPAPVEDDGVTCRKGCGRADFETRQSRGQHERHCEGIGTAT